MRIKEFKPHGIQLYTTLDCNANCATCYIEGGEIKTEMTWEQIKCLIAQAKEKNWGSVGCIGGEPLIKRKAFFRVLRYAQVLGMSVDVATNAFYGLSEKAADVFLRDINDCGGKEIRKNKVHLGLSVDAYHRLKENPSEQRDLIRAAANLTAVYLKGNFPNVELSLSGISDKWSRAAVRKFFAKCEKQGLVLEKYKVYNSERTGTKTTFIKEPLLEDARVGDYLNPDFKLSNGFEFIFSDPDKKEHAVSFFETRVSPEGRGIRLLEKRGILTPQNRDEIFLEYERWSEGDAPYSQRLVFIPLKGGLYAGMQQSQILQGKGISCYQKNGKFKKLDDMVAELNEKYQQRHADGRGILSKEAFALIAKKAQRAGIAV